MLHFVPHRKNQAIQGSALSALHSKKQWSKAHYFFERHRRPYYPCRMGRYSTRKEKYLKYTEKDILTFCCRTKVKTVMFYLVFWCFRGRINLCLLLEMLIFF